MQISIFLISSIITLFFCLVIGFFVYAKSLNKQICTIWILFCLSISLCEAAFLRIAFIHSKEEAMLWWQVANIGIIFAPVLFFHFICRMLDLKKNGEIVCWYILTAIFITLNIFDRKDFIGGLHLIHNEFYWISWNKNSLFHPFFYVYSWLFLLVYAFSLIVIKFRKATGNSRNQLRYFMLGAGISWIGGCGNFLSCINPKIYPITNFLVGVYAPVLGYAIIKYRLMDIKVVFTRFSIFAIIYALILGIPFWAGYKYGLWQIATWVMLVLATLGPLIYNFLRRQVEKRTLAEEHHAHELLQQASEGMMRYRSLKELLDIITHITSKTLKLENAAMFIVEENTGNFNLSVARLKSRYQYSEVISRIDPLVQKLSIIEESLVYEEVKLKAQELKNNSDDPIHEIESQMRKLQAAVIVPASLRGRLLGFLVLGEKKSKRMYSQDDLSTLWALSYQAALAMENALLYHKEKTLLANESRRQALADMAPGASHQFDNRLNTISATTDNLFDLIKNDSQGFSKEQLIETVFSELEVIRGEVTKGKQITEAILQKAKVKLEFDKVDIIKVIQNAINLTRLRRTRESLAGAKEPEFVFNYPKNLPQLFLCEGPIQDVFENMFNNAIDAIVTKENRKIEPQGYQGKITINISKQNKSLIVDIEDNGIGIPKESLHKLFTPYFTSKATAEKGVLGGSGLGLYVMRDFVERHGGTIGVESEYTKWTKFTINLPLDFKPSE